MSDTPLGIGWWYAADGKWYPPESAPEPEPPPLPRFGDTKAGPAPTFIPGPPRAPLPGMPTPKRAVPGIDAEPPVAPVFDTTQGSAAAPPEPPPAERRPRAQTGSAAGFLSGSPNALLVLIAASVGTLSAALSPFYEVGLSYLGTPAKVHAVSGTFTVTADGYGGWRALVPIAAVVTIGLSLIGVAVRFGRQWTASFAWVVRGAALATLGLVIAAMVAHQPSVGVTAIAQAAEIRSLGLHFGLTAWAWIGVASAAVANVAAFMS